jgi:tetratricopeptide (TPR) repeat protein
MHVTALMTTMLLASLIAGRSAPDWAPPPTVDQPRLYHGFGNFGRHVTTDSPRAQRFIDQGLQWLYGFNDDEAIRCFREAARLDPECAFAWWGIAYANGINVNDPVMSDRESRDAWDAVEEARERLGSASAVERALIEAVTARYAWPPPQDRRPLEEAFARKMGEAWEQFPGDADVGAIYAESLMNLQPWDYWTMDGEPKGRATEIVAILEQVIAMKPDHPGALHYYIHAVEASQTPERAEAAADRLAVLVPGSSHLTHMPSHIYSRVGRYADAADANERAVLADRAYLATAPEQDYYGLYISHNLHFLAYAAMMEGRFETAVTAAREMETHVPSTFMERYPEVADGWTSALPHVLVRFGRWQQILDLPEYPENRPISRAMRHYARSIAFSALGRTDEARAEIAAFNADAKGTPIDWRIGFNPAHAVFPLARKMMLGELLFREGEQEEAFRILAEAAELEDRLIYDEPPSWLQPVRHALGALLIAAGEYARAEVVYESDLDRNPKNGWSLLGIENARRAQGKTADLERIARARQRAWARADVTPTSSCYCEPGAVDLGNQGKADRDLAPSDEVDQINCTRTEGRKQ